MGEYGWCGADPFGIELSVPGDILVPCRMCGCLVVMSPEGTEAITLYDAVVVCLACCGVTGEEVSG